MKKICQLHMPSFYRSFAHSALSRVIESLESIKKAGFSGIYLIALWLDGGFDNGFDIIEYVVNPNFGTSIQLCNLIAKAHELGLEVGVDVVPNHVSDRNFLADKCLAGELGFEDALYVVSEEDAKRLTEAGVPSFFGTYAYSPIDEKYVRSTFVDYYQLNVNWDSKMVKEYFAGVFRRLKGYGVDFVRVDCGMMLHEDVTKADKNNPIATYDAEKSVKAVIEVAGGMPLFFEWFGPFSPDIFNGLDNCYALDCSYVLTGQQNLEWKHPKLVPLVGGHDQMTLADRGIDKDEALQKMEESPSEYAFLDMQTLLETATEAEIQPEDKDYDANLDNPNQRYRGRRPIKPVLDEFARRFT